MNPFSAAQYSYPTRGAGVVPSPPLPTALLPWHCKTVLRLLRMDNLTFPFQSPYPVWQEIPDADLTHFSDYYLPGQGLHQPFLEDQRRIVRSVCIDSASQQPAPSIPPHPVYSAKGSHQTARPLSKIPYFLKEKRIANNNDSHGLKGCSPKISDHLLQLSVFALFFLSTMPTTVPSPKHTSMRPA